MFLLEEFIVGHVERVLSGVHRKVRCESLQRTSTHMRLSKMCGIRSRGILSDDITIEVERYLVDTGLIILSMVVPQHMLIFR